MNKLAFIGIGNMGGAILKSVASEYSAADISIYCPTESKRKAMAASLGCSSCSSAREAVFEAKYIFLGVKPHIIREVIADISSVITKDQILVSMAAGITTASMKDAAGSDVPCIRIIPNTPCEIGRGLILTAPDSTVNTEDLCELETLLSPCGLISRTDENHADISMVLGGCTPAYVYMFVEALADGAVACGMKRSDAIAFAAKAVEGAASMILASGRHPGDLKDAVCSPGGSTIRGVKTLEENAFRGAVMNSIVSAYDKTTSLGK